MYPFFSFANCQPWQNSSELPSAWQVLRRATAPNPSDASSFCKTVSLVLGFPSPCEGTPIFFRFPALVFLSHILAQPAIHFPSSRPSSRVCGTPNINASDDQPGSVLCASYVSPWTRSSSSLQTELAPASHPTLLIALGVNVLLSLPNGCDATWYDGTHQEVTGDW